MFMSKIGVLEVWESENQENYILTICDPKSENQTKFVTLTSEQIDDIFKKLYEYAG